MAVLDIVHYGNPILRKICKPVTDFISLQNILTDMFDTMYEADGVGLAANQINLDLNLFVMDVTHTEEMDEPQIFINGKILERRGTSTFSEGCLSIPDVHLEIKRPEFIKFQYRTKDGKSCVAEFGGLSARVIQHEIDHLKGTFILDRVGSLVRMQYKKQLNAISKHDDQHYQLRNAKRDFVL